MPDMTEINAHVISEFRANDGVLSGPMEGAPVLLLTTVGRKSGQRYTTPVGFVEGGGGLVVAASNGGADADPDWFRNILAEPNVTIEVPGATIESVAAVATGNQRDDLLETLTAALPGMEEHRAATTRDIPVVVLTEAP